MIVVFERERVNARIDAQGLTYCYSLATGANAVVVVQHLVVVNRQVFFYIVEVVIIVVGNAIRRLFLRKVPLVLLCTLAEPVGLSGRFVLILRGVRFLVPVEPRLLLAL